ncbi:MAG TPA: GNAT family N-acetyltransferase [Rhizomicrobium sp.]|nr:GNAT family N-acetyltransferase [Rhizomicrobium sp.]
MSRREILVRLAATSDRRVIAACDARVAGDLHRRELIDGAIAARHCWVVEHAGAVAGYAVLTTNFFARDFLELVFVATDARRMGIGDALLDTIERSRRADRLFTSTNESNAAMRALLEKRGYEASGTILNLDANDPELVFVKFLRR